ncbi:hypothetical protein M899_2384 [Bacteriovorax sp. BSW11_IV]|uniref:RMD1 family protein n=1 Tax=Bacteriovorax sp. BSW11_IV TaxID=1353529 RepID=UPI00038A1193|nr:RMD1 family protein [Bacteriovorax sp. BSW11_IV]EQC44571.1 hypothetical protein M899_2384 [Bacteriovorax sp. BSW11_IV]
MNSCVGHCLADSFSFKELTESLAKKYSIKIFKDSIFINRDGADIFLFPYGVLVTWSQGDFDIVGFKEEIKSFMNVPVKEDSLSIDEFLYSPNNDSFQVSDDHIYLKENNKVMKLAISHAVAQSMKLSQMETSIQKSIEDTAHIPRELSISGTIKLTKKQMGQMRGLLYQKKSRVNLHYDLLDKPEFFWEYPELDDYYLKTKNYLEVENRLSVVNKKLEVIDQLLSILSEELNHRHSSKLEWIIIWLIAIELVIFLGHDLLKLF